MLVRFPFQLHPLLPGCYETLLTEPMADSWVNTSGAPLPKLSRVTPATAGLRCRYLRGQKHCGDKQTDYVHLMLITTHIRATASLPHVLPEFCMCCNLMGF
jgi:hypothetical protein